MRAKPDTQGYQYHNSEKCAVWCEQKKAQWVGRARAASNMEMKSKKEMKSQKGSLASILIRSALYQKWKQWVNIIGLRMIY